MNLLVTGGAGFIGSNLIRLIIDRPGIDLLVNLDALTYAGDLKNLEGIHNLHPRYLFEPVDLRNSQAIHDAVVRHRITHVMHLAAESHVDRSIDKADIFMETNVMGTLHLLNACRAYWKDGEHRFLQVSTDEVYGSLGPNDPPFTQESPLSPNSPYSASKAAADCLVRSYVKTYGFPAVITRCCNNYGPNQHFEKLIPTVLRCLHERRPIPVYGDGQQVREWIHVTDHAEALWCVLQSGRAGNVYNIGGGEELCNLQLIHELCDLMDKHQSNLEGSSRQLIRFVNDRPGHDFRYALNTSRAKDSLNWKPVVSLEDGLNQTVADFLTKFSSH